MILEKARQLKGEIGVFRPYKPASDREAWNALPEKLKSDLVKAGEDYLGFSYPFLPTTKYMEFCREGNRSHFEEIYFMRRRALNALIMAECVEYQGRFLDDIINGLMAICEESGWQLPAHNNASDGGHLPVADYDEPVMDLFLCETAAQVAVASYLLKESLDRESNLITKRIGSEIEKRVLKPYLNQHFWWMGLPGEDVNNWTPWCTQNTLIALLSQESISQETKQRIIEKACESLKIFMDCYGEDGCCNEGASYYKAAGLCLFNAVFVLNAVTENAFLELYKLEKVKNIAAYLMNVHVEDVYYANFADCAPRLVRAGVREFLFAKAVGNENMMRFAAKDHKKDENYLLPRSENLFYRLQAAFTEAEITAFPTDEKIEKPDIYYSSTGLLIARDENYFLAVKAGGNNDSHNHNDAGSITVYRKGKPFLIDVGVETYSRKTFSPQRYEIWTMQSAYHNVMTFGTHMQEAGREYRATVEEVELKEERAAITIELKDAYPAGILESWKRSVKFEKGKEIYVEDSFLPFIEGSYLSLMFLDKPVLTGDTLSTPEGGTVLLEGKFRAETEEILLEDAKLKQEWGDRLYRVKIYPAENKISFAIKN